MVDMGGRPLQQPVAQHVSVAPIDHSTTKVRLEPKPSDKAAPISLPTAPPGGPVARPPIVLIHVREQVNQAIKSVKQILKYCKEMNRCVRACYVYQKQFSRRLIV